MLYVLSMDLGLATTMAVPTRCGYEQGSDGQMLHVLTNPRHVCVAFMESGWSVHSGSSSSSSSSSSSGERMVSAQPA